MSQFMEPIVVTSATMTLTRHHAGASIFLDRAGGIAFTLPEPDAGLVYEFIVKTAPTTNCTISTSGGSNIIVLSVNELETDTTEDGPSDDDADVVTLVANVALPGDYLRFTCDGTKWYAKGQVRADGAVTSGTT
jgi:hypothetical protein